MTRIGYIGPCYQDHGGTETWHQILTSNLVGFDQVGYAVMESNGDPARLGCPLGVGEDAIRSLARSVDVLVVWGLSWELIHLLPSNRPKIVWVSHGSGFWSRDTSHAASLVVDRYVAVSEDAAAPLPKHRTDDVTIIPNAVPSARPTRGRDRLRIELGIGQDDVCLLYVGRMSIEKRAWLACAALARLPGSFKLLLAGDGPERDHCYGERVRHLGVRRDIADLMRAADMLVMPSEIEGYGLAIAEAWRAGLPVVSTKVGIVKTHPEWCQTVPVQCGAERFAAAIHAAWQDQNAMNGRAMTAFRGVRTLYSVEKFVGAWSQLLTEVDIYVEQCSRSMSSLEAAHACQHRGGDGPDHSCGECLRLRADCDGGVGCACGRACGGAVG